MRATVLLTAALSLSKNLLFIENGVSSVACSAGFASCKTFGKQPKHPCFGAKPPYRSSAICATASCSGFVRLTASILAWSGAVAPVKSPFPGERGQGDRDNKSEVYFKNRLFLQPDPTGCSCRICFYMPSKSHSGVYSKVALSLSCV